jgi:DNA-binding transcriptional regulator YdaS (Cro superfamily)
VDKEEFVALAESAYGRSWKSSLARDLGVYLSTINRWANGFTPISQKNAICIRSLCEKQRLVEDSAA